jgi:hypothetical protein
MQYCKPSLSQNSTSTVGSAVAGEAVEHQQIELPIVGDKFLLNVSPFGSVRLVDPDHIYSGQQLVEVEVKAIKKVNVSIE